MELGRLRAAFMEAREARESLATSPASPGTVRVFLSLNAPGTAKDNLLLRSLFARARKALLAALPESDTVVDGADALGPYALVRSPVEAAEAKTVAINLEERLPFGRLLDIDVICADGRQLGRRSLGLPPRSCLVCDEAAWDCIRAKRHSPDNLARAARVIWRSPLNGLAKALVEGARRELALTPKPGLVDRHDNGSHPDLSFELMSRSIDLLPRYYEDLIDLAESEAFDLAASVAAGLRAERRMAAAAGSNTHRGYIFLSGLLLVASALESEGTVDGWRRGISSLAGRLISGRDARSATPSHGETARRTHGAGGIHAEVLRGMTSVFDHGLPALRHALGRLHSREAAEHYAMAVLMGEVDDTTALHRCGPSGLSRLRRDSAALLPIILEGGNYLALLEEMNAAYRELGLTMGGVADCLALTIAIESAGLDSIKRGRPAGATITAQGLTPPFEGIG